MTIDPRQALKTVAGAPSLRRAPSARVRLAAAASLIALLAAGALATESLPTAARIPAAAAVAVIFIGWGTRRVASEAAWRRLDQAAYVIALAGTTLLGSSLIWPSDSRVGGWIAASLAALTLAGFLAIRWRR